jgi:hypothetical protein
MRIVGFLNFSHFNKQVGTVAIPSDKFILSMFDMLFVIYVFYLVSYLFRSSAYFLLRVWFK